MDTGSYHVAHRTRALKNKILESNKDSRWRLVNRLIMRPEEIIHKKSEMVIRTTEPCRKRVDGRGSQRSRR